MYIIQHLYNPTSEQHQHDIRHSIRHSIYIRYSFNNTLLIIQKNTLNLPERFFGTLLSFFSLKGFQFPVSSLGGNCQGYRGGFQISLPGTFSPSDIRRNNVVKFEDFVRVMLLKHKPAMTNELK